jgi:1,2-diacylglycerol 3-beta-glucosyltransferase
MMTEHSKVILIVEDEMVLAMSMQSIIENMGHRVSGIAISGEEAVKLAEEGRPNLVLMDITLEGEMDGIEAASQIIEKLNIPVIFVTGYSDDITLKRLDAVDHYGVLQKPVDEYTLKMSVENMLKKEKKQN